MKRRKNFLGKEFSLNKTLLLSFLLFLCLSNIYAQNNTKADRNEKIRIRGTVTDESGEALIGTTVSVKGTAYGTSADLEGKYSIEVPTNSTLTFNLIGYAEVNEPIEGRTEINVVMKDESEVLLFLPVKKLIRKYCRNKFTINM